MPTYRAHLPTVQTRRLGALYPQTHRSGSRCLFFRHKIKWILDTVPGARAQAKKGDLLFGTIDTWLLYKFTDGAVFATDHTNASRTMLYDICSLSWDENLLHAFDIPPSMLAQVKNSGDIYGDCNVRGTPIPIAALCGDQQASLLGQGCLAPGDAKTPTVPVVLF